MSKRNRPPCGLDPVIDHLAVIRENLGTAGAATCDELYGIIRAVEAIAEFVACMDVNSRAR